MTNTKRIKSALLAVPAAGLMALAGFCISPALSASSAGATPTSTYVKLNPNTLAADQFSLSGECIDADQIYNDALTGMLNWADPFYYADGSDPAGVWLNFENGQGPVWHPAANLVNEIPFLEAEGYACVPSDLLPAATDPDTTTTVAPPTTVAPTTTTPPTTVLTTTSTTLAPTTTTVSYAAGPVINSFKATLMPYGSGKDKVYVVDFTWSTSNAKNVTITTKWGSIPVSATGSLTPPLAPQLPGPGTYSFTLTATPQAGTAPGTLNATQTVTVTLGGDSW